MRTLRGTSVLVVGLGKSGLSATRLLCREGARVTATDERPLVPEAAELSSLGVTLRLGGLREDDFRTPEMVVTSPGVPLSRPEFAVARAAGRPIIGEIELASWFISEPILAITGTNGKSTTTALTGHICQSSGRATFTGGNLGRPLAERALGTAGEVVVCEVSSFQLEAIQTLHPVGAAFLNLTPDHLDRYPSHEAYGLAKMQLFKNQIASDLAVLNAEDPEVMRLAQGVKARTATFGHSKPSPEPGSIREDSGELLFDGVGGAERYRLAARSLRGRHNQENAMAAILLTRSVGVSASDVQKGLDSFPGLPHRLESVRTLRGVEWINDSKATNVDSTAVALKAFPAGVWLIAGGRGKGAPYAPLVELAKGRVRGVLTVGEDASAIALAFAGAVQVVPCQDLTTAVSRAASLSSDGDVVLLSPACASYDQFKNFEHRGQVFKALVNAL